MELCVISTKTSLEPLLEAVEELNEQGIALNLKLLYTHQLDEAGEASRQELSEALENADIVVIDLRTPTSWFVKELPKAINASKAKVVLPLVVGSPSILKLLRLGSFSGKFFESKAKEVDMDVEYLELSKVWMMMELTKKAGKALPLGPLKHLRNWSKCIDYWTLHGKRNLKNMLLLILKEYFNLEVSPEEPILEVPPGSVWDPIDGACKRLEEYVSHHKLDLAKPTVALLLYAGMHFDQCRPIAERLFMELRREGINVIPVVGGAAKELRGNVEMLKQNTVVSGKPVVDAVVNLQWFRLVGGPYGGPPEPTYNLFNELNCLLFNGLIMYMREVSKWEKDPRGIAPVEVVTAVALPEADGAIEPIPTAGLSDDLRKRMTVIDERLARRVERISRWVRLRRKPVEDRRLALIIYNYPPGEHNVGSATYLDVFASLEALMRRLKEEGYELEVLPKEELKELLLSRGLINSPQWTAFKDPIKLSLNMYEDYLAKLPSEARSRLIEAWGEPPGNVNVIEGDLVIPGVVLGNLFIGVQPSRGVHEEVDKLYHSKDLPPHHQYVAFYQWIDKVFKADVVVHLGTHGTLEFMPGKEVGLSGKCFPDLLIGNMPHLYVYHVTNPSEMTIAKRRGYAYTITHGSPPFTKADLYEDYVELEELLHELKEAEAQDPERVSVVKRLIEDRCSKLSLAYSSLDELYDKLFEMRRSIIPKGLHVLGERWSDEELVDYLAFVLRYDREVRSLHRVLAEAKGLDYDELLEKPHTVINGRRAAELVNELEEEARSFVAMVLSGKSDQAIRRLPRGARREAKQIADFVKDLASRVGACDELSSVVKALNGEYVQPRVAGDPLRTPEALPTGSHGYGFDPRLTPSKAAYLRGAKIAEDALKLYKEKDGRYPEAVGVVLWGFETMGTRGETIGQILQLLGVRLVRKHGPWSSDLEVIPLEELGRPRIDVVVTICGIFRDTFPNLITLIDRAVRLVASLEEPPEANYVRKHLLEAQEVYGADSTIRVFGPKDGAYNTRLTDMVESSAWRSEEELAKTYIEDMTYGYGENVEAKPLNELFRSLLSKVDLVSQVRYAHEYEVIDLDHYYEFLGGLKKAVEDIKGEKVDAVWIDTTLEKVKLRGLSETIDHAVRTRLLNPKWANAMLEHGYDGAREVAKRVEYVLGLAATTGEVPSWVWDKIAERYLFDEKLRERMIEENPWAVHEIAKRLYEAYARGYWKVKEDVLRKLKDISSEIEGLLEEKGG